MASGGTILGYATLMRWRMKYLAVDDLPGPVGRPVPAGITRAGLSRPRPARRQRGRALTAGIPENGGRFMKGVPPGPGREVTGAACRGPASAIAPVARECSANDTTLRFLSGVPGQPAAAPYFAGPGHAGTFAVASAGRADGSGSAPDDARTCRKGDISAAGAGSFPP